MDEFARLPSEQRRLYFEQAAARLNLTAQVIEKDFWVCWSLRRLFSLAEFRDHLTFKGGTSLSKVYRVIERFSEDVDVSIERSFLGFGGENEPEKGASGKERQRRIDRLKEACQDAIRQRLGPQLREAISTAIGDSGRWSLERDPADRDNQTLLFQYPPAITGSLSPYFSASVKLEMGALSDHYPVENASVTPYLSDAISDALSENTTHLRVLEAKRTFWEKATILHRLHHLPEGARIAPRMSRHYYDVFRLSQSPVWSYVLDSLDLLDRVVVQTRVFFKRAWAKYDEARTGKLRLSPSERIKGPLKQDYGDMRPMFFSEPPRFEQILARLPELENRINESKR